MYLIVADKGKSMTTRLMEWLEDAFEVSPYPHWNRVVIVVSKQRLEQLRSQYGQLLEDFDHRVFTYADIKAGRFPSRQTEYRLDNIETFIPLFFKNLNVGGFTVSPSNWKEDPQPPKIVA